MLAARENVPCTTAAVPHNRALQTSNPVSSTDANVFERSPLRSSFLPRENHCADGIDGQGPVPETLTTVTRNEGELFVLQERVQMLEEALSAHNCRLSSQFQTSDLSTASVPPEVPQNQQHIQLNLNKPEVVWSKSLVQRHP